VLFERMQAPRRSDSTPLHFLSALRVRCQRQRRAKLWIHDRDAHRPSAGDEQDTSKVTVVCPLACKRSLVRGSRGTCVAVRSPVRCSPSQWPCVWSKSADETREARTVKQVRDTFFDAFQHTSMCAEYHPRSPAPDGRRGGGGGGVMHNALPSVRAPVGGHAVHLPPQLGEVASVQRQRATYDRA
jgi:hypothetical protein